METWMEATSAAKRRTHPAPERNNGASKLPRLRAPPRRDPVNNELLTAAAKLSLQSATLLRSQIGCLQSTIILPESPLSVELHRVGQQYFEERQ
eukprot:8941684-Heterocapsa_arctica.AAC.1